MKKAPGLVLALALLAGGLFSSCERCVRCTRLMQGNFTASVERCGTKQEINDYEDYWQETSVDLDATDVKCAEQ